MSTVTDFEFAVESSVEEVEDFEWTLTPDVGADDDQLESACVSWLEAQPAAVSEAPSASEIAEALTDAEKRVENLRWWLLAEANHFEAMRGDLSAEAGAIIARLAREAAGMVRLLGATDAQTYFDRLDALEAARN